MEYGLAICYKKYDLQIPIKSYNEGMRSIMGVQNGINTEVLGIWTNIDHPIMRQKKLALNYYQRLDSLTCDQFIVKKIFKKYEPKNSIDSCFYQFKQKDDLILKKN